MNQTCATTVLNLLGDSITDHDKERFNAFYLLLGTKYELFVR